MRKYLICFVLCLTFISCSAFKETKAESYFDQGKLAFLDGDFAPAAEFFDKAADLLPESQRKGEILFEAGRSYMLCASNDIANRESLLQKALNRYVQADPNLEKGVAKGNNAMNLALVQMQMKNYQGAVESYTQAISHFKAPEDVVPAYRQRGSCYKEWGNTNMAEKDFNYTLDRYSNLNKKAEVHEEMGKMFADIGEYEKAMNNLGLAIVRYRSPENKATVCHEVGIIMEKVGNYPEAVKNYQNVLELTENPFKRSDALNSIGIIYFRQGKFKTADTLFDQALNYAPDNAQRLINSGFTKLFLSQMDTSLARLTRAIEIDPQKKVVLSRSRELATFFAKFGKAKGASNFRVKLQERMMPHKLPIPKEGKQ